MDITSLGKLRDLVVAREAWPAADHDWATELNWNKNWDIPGSPVVETSPSKAGHMGSISGPGGIHMPRRNWSHSAQVLKPPHPRLQGPQQEKPPQWEAHIAQLKSCPSSLQLEKSPQTSTVTQHSQKPMNE